MLLLLLIVIASIMVVFRRLLILLMVIMLAVVSARECMVDDLISRLAKLKVRPQGPRTETSYRLGAHGGAVCLSPAVYE